MLRVLPLRRAEPVLRPLQGWFQQQQLVLGTSHLRLPLAITMPTCKACRIEVKFGPFSVLQTSMLPSPE
jgi:hypothetical protein